MAVFISPETIDQINRVADIVSVVGEYVKLDKRGSDWWGCCPFHSEKTGSFHVVPDKNLYYCFGCHAAGGTIKFVQEVEKISFVEAVTLLAKRFGVEIIYSNNTSNNQLKYDNSKDEMIELYNRISTLYHYSLTQDKHGKFALDYIRGRGITMETIEKFKLGYSFEDRYWLKKFLKNKNFSDDFLKKSGLFSSNYPDISFFSDRLMFPIFDRRGQCVAFGGRILHPKGDEDRKYLNSRELPHYSKKDILYAFNFAKDSIRLLKSAIICEGYMDCIAYHQCGIKNAVATCGTALTENHLKVLKNFADTILLSFDSDGAGQNATKKSILMCRKNGFSVKIVKLRGGKDPAEIMVNYGAEVLTGDINNAILDSDYLFEVYSHEYPVDTPEGKSKACLAFFDYVDALQTDIQKESSLEQLSQKFNISMQSVKRDFLNRKQAQNRLIQRTQENKDLSKTSILKVNAEIRALFAVIADTNQFELMRRELNEDVFESKEAKELFIILEDCYQCGNLSLSAILNKCENKSLENLIAKSVASGEFSQNTEQTVKDSIALIKRYGLERHREYILAKLKELKPITEDDRKEIKFLLEEKMNIDNQLK